MPSPSTTHTEDNTPPRIVVIGVGNLLMKDEGIGIHVLQALQQIPLPEDVRLIDGGTSPDLIAYTKSGDRLILVDSAKAGSEPGAVYRFKPEDLAPETTHLTSAHELGVAQNLSLMSLLGNCPADTVVIGIEPGEIAPGLELSAALQQRLPVIVKAILEEIQKP